MATGNLTEERLETIERGARERRTLMDRVVLELVEEIRRLRNLIARMEDQETTSSRLNRHEGSSRGAEWLSTRDAERLGVSLRTLHRFIDQGVLPAYKMGRVLRLRSIDVTSFAANPPGPSALERLDPDGDDPGQDLSGVRAPRRSRPFQPPGAEHLGLPEV